MTASFSPAGESLLFMADSSMYQGNYFDISPKTQKVVELQIGRGGSRTGAAGAFAPINIF